MAASYLLYFTKMLTVKDIENYREYKITIHCSQKKNTLYMPYINGGNTDT
jgi:hypothetical protein